MEPDEIDIDDERGYSALRASLDRIVAGIVGAAITSIALYLMLWLFARGASTLQVSWADQAAMALFGLFFGTFFGSPIGIIAMCCTRARQAPWRTLPLVLIGTVLGAFVVSVPSILRWDHVLGSWTVLIALLGPTAGGYLATLLIPKQRPSIA